MADDDEEPVQKKQSSELELEIPVESEPDLVSDRNAEYQIRPALVDKFKAQTVKELIYGILNEELKGKTYSLNLSEVWAKKIVAQVKDSVKELNFKRYKLIVQTIVGENRGSGVKVGARCLWDADTDNLATHSFLNETIFCCVVVFGIYCY